MYRSDRVLTACAGTLVAAGLCALPTTASAQTATTWGFTNTSDDVFSGTAPGVREFTSDGNTIKVAAFAAPNVQTALTRAFVSFANENGTSPQNSAGGGLGVWTANAELTSSSQWPYPSQLDNSNGVEFLIFALPSDEWQLPGSSGSTASAFDVNEAYTSQAPFVWAQGRTDVVWWVGGTLATGGTADDPFSKFAGKSIGTITTGWVKGSSTGSSGDRTVATKGGKGRYVIIAAEAPNSNQSSQIDGFYIENLTVRQVGCVDAAAPSFTLASSAVSYTATGGCGITLPDLSSQVANLVDDCSKVADLTISQSPAAGTWRAGEGTSAVALTVTDKAGRSTTKSINLTVLDPPVVTSCPGNRVIDADQNCQVAMPDLTSGMKVSDQCTSATGWTFSQSIAAGTALVSATVSVTATDSNGNTATCSNISISHVDVTQPEITCPDNYVRPTDVDGCAATWDAGQATAEDNCSVGAEELALTCDGNDDVFVLGTTTVTWTATDEASNAATCAQTITVTDQQAPSLFCPPALAVATDPGQCRATVGDLGTATAWDNCEATGPVTSDARGGFELGSTSVTWQVEDAAGNRGTCTQQVTVADTEAPTLQCPEDVTLVSSLDSCAAYLGDLGQATVADNCGDASATSDAAFPYGVGTSPITYSATDAAGNASAATCTQHVTVVSAAGVGFLPPLAGQPVANQVNDGTEKLPIKVRLVDCAGLPLAGNVKVVLEVEGIRLTDGGATQIVGEEIAEDPNGRGDVVDGEALMEADGTSGQYQFNIDTRNWGHTNTIADLGFFYKATVSVYDATALTFLGSEAIVLETKPKTGARK